MPRKKETSAAALPPSTAETDTITLTVEVDKTLYGQIKAATAAGRYSSVEEWLLEIIADKV